MKFWQGEFVVKENKEMFIKKETLHLLAAVVLIIVAIFFLGVQLPSPSNLSATQSSDSGIDKSKLGLAKAPELQGISGYINSDSNLLIKNLRGKVVLVDFWTYSCINCIRTQPYLNEWDQKYASKGLVIIGVHSPEFDFEKDYGNVKNAVKEYDIKYPVVQDNDFQTWRAYNNRYWPHKYLVDKDGYIRFDHIGEGGYEETEAQIVQLLKEIDSNISDAKVSTDVNAYVPDFGKALTPELYVGYGTARKPIGNTGFSIPDSVTNYSLPSQLSADTVYFEGTWRSNYDSMELDGNLGRIVLVFSSKKVHIVASNSDSSSSVLATVFNEGAGIFSSTTQVKNSDLYTVVSLDSYAANKKLVLDVNGMGFKLFTFTFG